MTVIDSLKSILHKDSPSTKRNSKSLPSQPQPQPVMNPAPPSVQQANYAAYAPEPNTQSEYREFGVQNPAAQEVTRERAEKSKFHHLCDRVIE